jgi:hypothetical protein
MPVTKLSVILSVVVALLGSAAQAQGIYTTTSRTVGNTTTSVTTTPQGSTITRSTTVGPL